MNLGIFVQVEEKAHRNPPNTVPNVAMKEITRKIKDDNPKQKGTCLARFV